MKAELAQLIALQNADNNTRTLQAEIESIPQRRAEIEKEFDQRAFEIRGLEEKRDAAFHERARLEKEVFEQRQRAERADRNLMAAKKPDEYTAAIREAGALLPLSPLAACHVCIATSTDDVDEMIAAAARAFRRLSSQAQRRSP